MFPNEILISKIHKNASPFAYLQPMSHNGFRLSEERAIVERRSKRRSMVAKSRLEWRFLHPNC